MNSKLKKEISKLYQGVDLPIMLIFSAVIIWFKPLIGVICLIICAGVFAYHKYISSKYLSKKLARHKDYVLKERSDLMDTFSKEAPLLLCVISENGDIQWSNGAFDEAVAENGESAPDLGKNNIKALFEGTKVQYSLGNKIYDITSATLQEFEGNYRFLFWNDVTDKVTVTRKFSDFLVCIAFVNIDNFDDILSDAPTEHRGRIIAQLDDEVFGWAKEIEATVFRSTNNRYVLLFKNGMLDGERKNGFRILNKVREIETTSDIPVSLSIGVGHGEGTFEALQESAKEALELALGRGGDQAVLRTIQGDTEYFGGVLPSVEKRNKGKSRVMAHAFASLIADADKIFVAGHANPDMDAFGSVIGMYQLAKNLGAECYIVLDEPGEGIADIYEEARALGIEDFVDHKYAEDNFTTRSLLILTDHHRSVISEDPALLEKAHKVAIVDHHRRAADAIENLVLSYMESYASSASELVTEILQYSGDKGDISDFEANALLAGITLDTKNFTTNTGVRTFEAASWLKRNGADTAKVKEYFKMDLDFYQKKLGIIANTEVLANGVAVAYTKEKSEDMQIIISNTADELLSMKGVKAAIVAGSNGHRTMVSARSNGKINVQTLMEKLGGGGHQNVAAVQLDVSPEEALSQVVQAMRVEGLL